MISVVDFKKKIDKLLDEEVIRVEKKFSKREVNDVVVELAIEQYILDLMKDEALDSFSKKQLFNGVLEMLNIYYNMGVEAKKEAKK